MCNKSLVLSHLLALEKKRFTMELTRYDQAVSFSQIQSGNGMWFVSADQERVWSEVGELTNVWFIWSHELIVGAMELIRQEWTSTYSQIKSGNGWNFQEPSLNIICHPPWPEIDSSLVFGVLTFRRKSFFTSY